MMEAPQGLPVDLYDRCVRRRRRWRGLPSILRWSAARLLSSGPRVHPQCPPKAAPTYVLLVSLVSISLYGNSRFSTY